MIKIKDDDADDDDEGCSGKEFDQVLRWRAGLQSRLAVIRGSSLKAARWKQKLTGVSQAVWGEWVGD